MLEEMKQRVVEEYAKQKVIQGQQPAYTSPGPANRKIGIILLVFVGVPLTIINSASWLYADRLFIILLAANLVVPGIGLYMLVTGQSLGPKRQTKK